MSANKKKGSTSSPTIAVNRQAGHDYFIEERFEAGLGLEGWEVKSLRAGRVQLKESYVVLKAGEAFLQGAHISPLISVCSHVIAEAVRNRKLLLHRHELNKMIGQVERKGYTLIPLQLVWRRGRVKLELGLARGKKQHDKRATEKERDWEREKQRVLRRG